MTRGGCVFFPLLHWMGPGRCAQSFRTGRHFGYGCGRWRGRLAFSCRICHESLLGRMFRPDFCLDPSSSVVAKQAASICCLHGAWASRWLRSIWPASQTNGDESSEGLPAGFAGLCSLGRPFSPCLVRILPEQSKAIVYAGRNGSIHLLSRS